uniref:Uncharacterized protein n=1 Tax=Brassica oleracea TaxID=3712 RepID=A0A3P6CRS6_BRAOL|nr:unnamed protein product [Brassica oleracea]
MAMKTSHAPLFRLLFLLLSVVGLVGASGGKMVPEISTPPLGSCGAAIAKDDSPQTLAKRPPCRRPRLQNSEDVTHSTLP